MTCTCFPMKEYFLKLLLDENKKPVYLITTLDNTMEDLLTLEYVKVSNSIYLLAVVSVLLNVTITFSKLSNIQFNLYSNVISLTPKTLRYFCLVILY